MTRSASAVVAACLLAGAGTAWAKTAPASIDPRVTDHELDDGHGWVHAPN